MGNPIYSSERRTVKAASLGYHTKSRDEIFVQNRKARIHESMRPAKALLRESCDSENHPNSFPIILGLDFTGSMRQIPHYLVQNGLPHIMEGIIDNGIPDPQILFLGIGDHEVDNYPLQVGQFESGDEELDMWLTRSYLEGGGGANYGESYHLAWYFAANHTKTDAWDKRKQKGLIFTIGDEPCLESLPSNAIEEIMENGSQASYSDKELIELASEKYDIYHLHMMEGSAGPRSIGYWEDLLGQNCVKIEHKEDVAKTIVDIVTRHAKDGVVNVTSNDNVIIDSKPEKKDDIEIL